MMYLTYVVRQQPGIAQIYFSDPTKRSRADVDSSNASLRGTLKSLQVSDFGLHFLVWFCSSSRPFICTRDSVLPLSNI